MSEPSEVGRIYSDSGQDVATWRNVWTNVNHFRTHVKLYAVSMDYGICGAAQNYPAAVIWIQEIWTLPTDNNLAEANPQKNFQLIGSAHTTTPHSLILSISGTTSPGPLGKGCNSIPTDKTVGKTYILLCVWTKISPYSVHSYVATKLIVLCHRPLFQANEKHKSCPSYLCSHPLYPYHCHHTYVYVCIIDLCRPLMHAKYIVTSRSIYVHIAFGPEYI